MVGRRFILLMKNYKERKISGLLLYFVLFLFFLIFSFISIKSVISLEGKIKFYDLSISSNDENFADYYPLWNEIKSSSTIEKLPALIPFSIFYIIGKLFNLQPIWFFILVYTFSGALIGLSSFYCSKYFLKSIRNPEYYWEIFTPFLGSIFYFWSTFRLTHTSHLFMIFVYGLIPLIYISYIRGISENKISLILFSAVLLSISGLRLFIYMIPFITLHFIISMILNGLQYLKTKFRLFALFLILFPLFSAYWIMPNIFNPYEISSYAITPENLEFLYRNSNALGIFSLQNNWILRDRYFSGQIGLSSLTIIILAISFICLIKPNMKRKQLEIFITSIFFLISFTIALGPNLVITKKILFYLIFDIPFHSFLGWAFRTPKIIEMLFLFIIILFTISSYDILIYVYNVLNGFARNIIIFSIVVFLLTAIFLPVWPLATGDLNDAIGEDFTYVDDEIKFELRSIFTLSREFNPSIISLFQWNFENSSGGWQCNTPRIKNVTLDKYSFEGQYSLKTELNYSAWGWKVIKSPIIPVETNITYYFDFYVSGENAHQVHMKILEYYLNRTIILSNRIGFIGYGNFSFKNIHFKYTPSKNTSYIELQIWHGHETTQKLPNKIWIDKVRIYEYPPSDLDVIWIYSVKSENETLEDILSSDENPIDVMEYRKINPIKYLVKVNATKYFILSFAESYDPRWKAYINGEKIGSIPIYSIINGFWVNQTGLLEIIIEYEPQRWFYYGSAISVTTLIVSFAYLLWDRKKKIINDG